MPGAPTDTRSFVLSHVDRHPVAGDYAHWLVVDIVADVTSLKTGAGVLRCRADRALARALGSEALDEQAVS